MNEKIVDMIVELAKTGGNTAVWMYGMYVVGTVLKYVVGFGFFLLAVRTASKAAQKVAKIMKGQV